MPLPPPPTPEAALSAAAGDALFTTLARFHGPRPWGAVLDAGTGWHSLQWIAGLPTARWTAVTGAAARERDLARRLGPRLRGVDRLVTGNWTDPVLLPQDDLYDVILADYLLGAIDGWAPYYQTALFPRLCRHLRPGGWLYVVGLEPYADAPDSEAGRLVTEIARLRDACILLAGDRCYREYPRSWVHAALEAAGLVIEESVAVPIVYRRRFVDGQLDVCLRKLPRIADPVLRGALRSHIEALRVRGRALADRPGGLPFGEDYVVMARRPGPPAAPPSRATED